MDETEPPRPVRHRARLGPFVAAAVALAAVALIGNRLLTPGAPPASVPPPASVSPPASGASPITSVGPPPSSGSGATPSAPLTASLGYLVSPADLAERVSRGAQGIEPWQSARQGLLADVDAALKGSPHAKVALNIPGTDGPFVDDTASAYGLALAYAVTGDPQYAAKSRTYIMAWASTNTRLLNACPDTGACQTSLIVGRVVADFVFAADLIRPSGVMSSADDAAFRAWLHDLILPILSRRINNWGDTGDFSRAVIADYLGDRAGFDAALADWKTKMDMVASDGHIPEEVRRGTAGFSYTQEALQYKIGTARLAELRGVDLWSYVGAQGGSLNKAIGVLRTYWFAPASWPWHTNVKIPDPGAMWEIAYQHFRDPAWPAVFAGSRPFGLLGHSAIRWTTLTNGIAIP
jgi:hypothetical protein